MERIRESNIEEMIEDMKRYSQEIKKMSPQEARDILIRIGVLDEEGNQKEQICTGNNQS